jgi:hypothetical protein
VEDPPIKKDKRKKDKSIPSRLVHEQLNALSFPFSFKVSHSSMSCFTPFEGPLGFRKCGTSSSERCRT